MLKLVIFASVLLCATAFLVGGFESVDIDDDGVVEAAHHATKELGKKFATPYHSKLHKILKAKQQVVNGMNYRMNVIVGLTDCKKTDVEFEDVENCNFQEGVSTYRKCEVLVYRSLKNEHKLVSSGCILAGKNEI